MTVTLCLYPCNEGALYVPHAINFKNFQWTKMFTNTESASCQVFTYVETASLRAGSLITAIDGHCSTLADIFCFPSNIISLQAFNQIVYNKLFAAVLSLFMSKTLLYLSSRSFGKLDLENH